MKANANNQTANVNVNANTNAVVTSEKFAELLKNASAYAGVDPEEMAKAICKSLKSTLADMRTFNGMYLLMLKGCTKEQRAMMDTPEMKALVRGFLPNVTIEQLDKEGNVVKTLVALAKWGTDPDEAWVAPDNKIMGDFVSCGKAAKLRLKSYRYSSEEVAHEVADYADLRHARKHSVAVTETFTSESGEKRELPVYKTVVDEKSGKEKRVLVTEIVEDYFVPAFTENVSPKAFMAALTKAVAQGFMLLFPEKK